MLSEPLQVAFHQFGSFGSFPLSYLLPCVHLSSDLLVSIYRIWHDVVDLGLSRVIVFEDDLRFTEDGLERIKEVLEDLDYSKMEWDLIYLGRKKQVDQVVSCFVTFFYAPHPRNGCVIESHQNVLYCAQTSLFQEEVWVPQHRHLSTVGYSYWTLGYILSNEGARRLLDAKPLKSLLPVDEYLPIMFDKHPNKVSYLSFFHLSDEVLPHLLFFRNLGPKR